MNLYYKEWSNTKCICCIIFNYHNIKGILRIEQSQNHKRKKQTEYKLVTLTKNVASYFKIRNKTNGKLNEGRTYATVEYPASTFEIRFWKLISQS